MMIRSKCIGGCHVDVKRRTQGEMLRARRAAAAPSSFRRATRRARSASISAR
jgi:hypothetical protein